MSDKNIPTIAKDFERKIDETFELWFNKKMNREDAMNILKSARGEYERNVLRVALREALKRSRNDLDFITQTQDELESNLTKFFHIESVDFADDYKDAKYFPIYLLKKRDE